MQQDVLWSQQCLAGDPGAYGHLIRTYQSEVYYLVFAWVKSPEDAEEVTQEVFLKAYQNLASLRRPEHFRAWLRQIARNTCQDWQRRQRPAFEMLQTDVASDMPAAWQAGRNTHPGQPEARLQAETICPDAPSSHDR